MFRKFAIVGVEPFKEVTLSQELQMHSRLYYIGAPTVSVINTMLGLIYNRPLDFETIVRGVNELPVHPDAINVPLVTLPTKMVLSALGVHWAELILISGKYHVKRDDSSILCTDGVWRRNPGGLQWTAKFDKYETVAKKVLVFLKTK